MASKTIREVLSIAVGTALAALWVFALGNIWLVFIEAPEAELDIILLSLLLPATAGAVFGLKLLNNEL